MNKYPSPRIENFTSLKEFLNLQLAELLPNQDMTIKNHLNLIEYIESKSPLFLLRKFKNHSNRGNAYCFENSSFTVSDNEPALWVFMETYYKSELDFFNLIENQILPIAFAIKAEEREGIIWNTIGRKHKDFSANGWKHCHIFQCSPLGEQIKNINDLKRRCLRLLSPLNHFPFFSPKKFLMPYDYGENEKCIEYLIWFLYNKYYSDINKSHFKAFVEEQNFTIPIEEPNDINIDYLTKKCIVKMATKKHQVESKIEILSNFKISKNWYGKNKVVIVNFNNGRYANITYQYNHDDVYKNTISHLEKLNCWSKYGYYSSSNNIPKWAKEFVTET